MKKPLAEKEIPAAGFEYKIQPATDAGRHLRLLHAVPATATMAQTAQIVLRDGVILPEKKKPVPRRTSRQPGTIRRAKSAGCQLFDLIRLLRRNRQGSGVHTLLLGH